MGCPRGQSNVQHSVHTTVPCSEPCRCDALGKAIESTEVPVHRRSREQISSWQWHSCCSSSWHFGASSLSSLDDDWLSGPSWNVSTLWHRNPHGTTGAGSEDERSWLPRPLLMWGQPRSQDFVSGLPVLNNVLTEKSHIDIRTVHELCTLDVRLLEKWLVMPSSKRRSVTARELSWREPTTCIAEL